MDEPLGALNLPRLEQHIAKMREGYESADAKTDALRSLERMKDKFVALESVEQQAKHEVRRNVAQLGKRISDVGEGAEVDPFGIWGHTEIVEQVIEHKFGRW